MKNKINNMELVPVGVEQDPDESLHILHDLNIDMTVHPEQGVVHITNKFTVDPSDGIKLE